jgi:molybdate transport system permease protein
VSFAPLLLSLEVATIAVVVATVLGVAIGTTLATKRFWGRDAVDVLLTTPMILPPTVLGYYLLGALGRTSVVGRAYEAVVGDTIVFTKVGAVIAATIGALPLVAKAARSAVEGVDPALVAAARTLGATPWRALSTVVFPLASRGILGGVMLGFARALGDFGVTLMIAGDIPGVTRTASLAIYGAIQAGRDAQAAGMVAVLTAISVVVLYVVGKLGVRREA